MAKRRGMANLRRLRRNQSRQAVGDRSALASAWLWQHRHRKRKRFQASLASRRIENSAGGGESILRSSASTLSAGGSGVGSTLVAAAKNNMACGARHSAAQRGGLAAWRENRGG